MGLWEEMNDFSAWNKKIPCILCKEFAEKTLIGEHWKCGTCDHLFNENGKSLLENIICYCKICFPTKESENKIETTIIKQVKDKIKKIVPSRNKSKKGKKV